MRTLIATLVLVTLAPFAAAGQPPASTAARGVAEREASLKKKIAAAPDDAQAYFDLADLQKELGAAADAEATLIEARQALPTDKNILIKLAYFYSLGQFEKAMAMLHLAARLDPVDPGIQHMTAVFYQDKVYRDTSLNPTQRRTYVRDGIAAADRALAIKPDYMEAVVYKGILLKAWAEFTATSADKTRTLAEADALMKRAAQLRANRLSASDPRPSSTPPPPPPPPPAPPPPPPPLVPPPPPPPPPGEPVKVGAAIQAPARIKNVPPVYPAEAAASRTQGAVIIEATIDTSGRVSNTKVLRSVPILDQAALDAVEQWVYEPTYLSGQAVPVIMTVTVNFSLQ